MNKTFSTKQVVAIAAFCTALAVAITAMSLHFVYKSNLSNVIPGDTTNQENVALFDKLQEIKALVNKYYVGDVDSSVMADSICAGYVAGLEDKYSGYVDKENAETSLNTLYGVNSGMGVQVSQHPDSLTMFVLEVHEDSPAMKAGIKANDEIVSVDGNLVAEYGYAETLAYIKSVPLGTDAHLVINRGGKTVELDVTMMQFNSQSVFHRLIDDKGYILITGFNDLSPAQFTNAVESLYTAGAKSLIIDLRGNGGGTLNSVYQMLDYCIPKGLAIKVEYKDEKLNEEYMSDEREVNLPIVCLTDENTASAAELFSQGLKDYGKAITVGRLTYGKGVVQRTFTLSDGSLVRFTIGKYYTQNGVCLDGIGVKPDIKIDYPKEELQYRYVNGIEKDKDFLAACEYLDNQPS